MKKQVIGMMGAAAIFSLSLGACDFDQPLPECPVPHQAPFSPGTLLRYTLVEGDANQSCGQLEYDFIGLAKYEDRGTDNPVRVGLRLASLGELAPIYSGEPLDADDNLSAVGTIDRRPSEDGFCSANDFSVMQVTRGAGDPLGPLDLRYQFSDFRSVSTAVVPGSQFTTKVAFTDENCTATYEAVGMWPAVPCADESGAPSDALCNPAQVEGEAPVLACNDAFECINPDFAVTCDPVSLHCIPAGPIPALKEGISQ